MCSPGLFISNYLNKCIISISLFYGHMKAVVVDVALAHDELFYVEVLICMCYIDEALHKVAMHFCCRMLPN